MGEGKSKEKMRQGKTVRLNINARERRRMHESTRDHEGCKKGRNCVEERIANRNFSLFWGIMLRYLLDKFWDENVWLPPNTSWDDVAPGPDKPVTYNDHRDLLYVALPLTVILTVLRHIMERYWFAPLGRSLGIKSTRLKKADTNPILEAAYQASPNINKQQTYALAKQLDLSERQVEQWLRLRRAQNKPSTLTKFCESAWKGSFLLASLAFEMWLLWDKDWPWDTNYCFIGYPHQGITNDVWWFYMVLTGYYCSLFASQFWDIRRKDFWQVFVHHLATVVLLTISWVCNLHRIGTMLPLTHDLSDMLLETLKAAKYAGYQKTCDFLFAVFALVWFVTRLVIFPFHVLSSMLLRFPVLVGSFPISYFCSVLGCTLLVLNIYWTWLIIKIASRTIRTGQVEGDIRSESSDEEHHVLQTQARTRQQ